MAAVVALGSSTSASAQNLRVVVPFAAGGAVDKVARVIANRLPPDLGAIVDNRGGAGGDLGVNAVERAAPDGRTVLLHTSSLIINAAYRKGEAESVLKNFRAIAKVGGVKFVLVVRKALPAATVQELIAYSRAGNQLNYGSTGSGTTLHVAGEMLKQSAGITATHIPYRGLAPAFNDLLAGNIDFMVTSVTGIIPFVKEGSMRALAVFDADGAEELPDVPTTAQLGFKDLMISNWYGFFVQPAVPAAARQKLEEAVLTAIRNPEVQQLLAADGIRGSLGGDQFQAELEAEAKGLPLLLKRLNIAATN
jgi:tripartite-type tricarboxylate transporter receptor subunit TctC